MAQLWPQIRDAIERGDYVISAHAMARLRQRRIPGWQAIGLSFNGELIVEKNRTKPNPSVEVRITLADGAEAKVVWSWLATDATAKLVTVHFFDR